MTQQEIDEKLNKIQDGIYKIAVALVSIADFADLEGYEYGFEEEIKAAREYIQKYEEDHNGGK